MELFDFIVGVILGLFFGWLLALLRELLRPTRAAQVLDSFCFP